MKHLHRILFVCLLVLLATVTDSCKKQPLSTTIEEHISVKYDGKEFKSTTRTHQGIVPYYNAEFIYHPTSFDFTLEADMYYYRNKKHIYLSVHYNEPFELGKAYPLFTFDSTQDSEDKNYKYSQFDGHDIIGGTITITNFDFIIYYSVSAYQKDSCSIYAYFDFDFKDKESNEIHIEEGRIGPFPALLDSPLR